MLNKTQLRAKIVEHEIFEVSLLATGPIMSGQGEAQAQLYKKVAGGQFVWYYKDADHVYYDPDDPKSQGMGGASIPFTLEDGTVETVKGPWASTAESLYTDTGIDLRNDYYSWGVISVEKQFEGARTVFKKVIHKDSQYTQGPSDRIQQLAQKYANILDRRVYFYVEGQGGSSSSFVDPKYA